MTDESKAILLGKIRSTHGYDIPQTMWPVAEALQLDGAISLGRAEGPARAWNHAELSGSARYIE